MRTHPSGVITSVSGGKHPTGPLMPRMFFVLLWNAAHVGLALYVIVLTATARAPRVRQLHPPQVLPPREVQPHAFSHAVHTGALTTIPHSAPLARLSAILACQHKPTHIAAPARLSIEPSPAPTKPPSHAPRALIEAHNANHNANAPRRRSDTAHVVSNRKPRKWHGITTHIQPRKTQYRAHQQGKNAVTKKNTSRATRNPHTC